MRVARNDSNAIRTAMNKFLMRTASAFNTWVYRVSDGRFGATFAGGAPVCLLTTQGRKSRQRRTVPLLYLADGDDLVVVASQGGAPIHPGWYFNLVAEPTAEVQVGRRRFAVTGRAVSEAEKAALWPRVVAIYPPYEAYQRRTTRSIPVVRLRPPPRGRTVGLAGGERIPWTGGRNDLTRVGLLRCPPVRPTRDPAPRHRLPRAPAGCRHAWHRRRNARAGRPSPARRCPTAPSHR